MIVGKNISFLVILYLFQAKTIDISAIRTCDEFDSDPLPASKNCTRTDINYSFVDVSTLEPTNSSNIGNEETGVEERQLPRMRLYLEVDHQASKPRIDNLRSFFKVFIEELLDISSISQRYTLVPSPVTIQYLELLPVTLFPANTSGKIPMELTAITSVIVMEYDEIPNNAEEQRQADYAKSSSFLKEAEEALGHSMKVYLTLWNCTEITRALEEDCGLRSPHLISVQVGYTQIATDHCNGENVEPHEYHEETISDGVSLSSVVLRKDRLWIFFSVSVIGIAVVEILLTSMQEIA